MPRGELIDMTGKTYNSWKVLHRIENDKRNQAVWLCECLSCGNSYPVSGSALRSGHSKKCKHCGNKKHGGAMDGTKTRLYSIWLNMRVRCHNQNVPEYKYYGGKGIKITKSWDSFDSFQEWALSSGYDDALTIDRIDGEGDYCPENCRWITQQAQVQNRPKKMSLMTGVFFRKYRTDSTKNRNYIARVEKPGFFKYIGAFYTELEAAIARDLFLLESGRLKEHNGNFLSYEKLMNKEKFNEELHGTV